MRGSPHPHTSFLLYASWLTLSLHRSQATTAQTTATSLGTERWSMGSKSCRQEVRTGGLPRFT